jgi:hypothetical protein
MAGAQCYRPATAVLRIASVGDRAICSEHIATLEALGMAFRRLDDTTPVPEWRQRSLRRDLTPEMGL